MDIHHSLKGKRPSYLLLDESERVATLPTNFIQSLECSPRQRSQATLELYTRRLRDFCSFLEDHQVFGQYRVDDAVRAIGLPVIDEFYRACSARGLGASTIRGYEVLIKQFTDWLTTEEAGRVRVRALYENVSYRTPRPQIRMPRYLTVDQVISLLKGMQWEAQRLVAHFIYDTGLRASEVPRVLKIDLPLIEHYPSTLMYFPMLVRGSKARGRQFKERYTIISRPMLVRINRYFKSRTYFTNHDWPENKKPAFLNTYGKELTTKAIQASISDALSRTDLIAASAHRLRHGTAYSVMKSGHGKTLLDNLIVLQRALGHSKLATTEIYTHIPAPVLHQMTEERGPDEVRYRFEEAQKIIETTFLPEKQQRKVRVIGRINEQQKK